MGCDCGSMRSPGAVAAAAADANVLCCPTECLQTTTVGDPSVVTPAAFDVPVADGQLLELTLTGYVTRLDVNTNGLQEGFVYLRGIARRNDGDNVLPGLAILFQSAALQESNLGLGLLPTGVDTAYIITGNTLQVQLTSNGTWFWDLQLNSCLRDQVVNVEGGG